jgi:hypothetical protein
MRESRGSQVQNRRKREREKEREGTSASLSLRGTRVSNAAKVQER